MKTASTSMIMQNSAIRSSLLVTIGLLLIPLLGMQLSSEWSWDETDFIIMGALIFGTSLLFNLAMKTIRHNNRRILVGAGIVMAFLYIWAELAVGIFTNLGS